MKKRILSLTLGLALCLGLAAPAFAVKSEGSAWNIDCPDNRIIEEAASFKVRRWNRESLDEYEGVFTGLGEVSDLVIPTVYLEPGDMITLTAKNFSSACIEAWSDPDGDGIYDQRLCKFNDVSGASGFNCELLPVSTVGPIEFRYFSEDRFYSNAPDLFYSHRYSHAILASFDGSTIRDEGEDVGYDVWVDVPISVDYLLEQYGPNTLLELWCWDEELESWRFWGLHLPNSQPAAAQTPTAYPSTQSVLVDGAPVEFQCYALKDGAGNDTNYIKLRDVASVLNGTAVQFNVGWDGAVNIETGKAYAPNGSEMSTPFSGERAYEPATAETRIDGSPAALDAIVLKDDAGGAYTYYKLRDLGAALGFTVDWSATDGISVKTK